MWTVEDKTANSEDNFFYIRLFCKTGLTFSSIHEEKLFPEESGNMKRRKAALVTMIAEEELSAESKSERMAEENPSWVIIDVGGDRFQARR